MTDTLPASLSSIQEDFLALPQSDRLQLLLEFADDLPPLPPRLAGHEQDLERVEECQSPVFITVTIGEDGDAPGIVRMHATAPQEAPTTRGFASILAHGISGLTTEEVLAIPSDYPLTIGLTQAVSPLRLRGMMGMLGRVKRRVKEASL